MSDAPGGGRSRGGHQKVRTARRRTTSSNRWLERQLNDPYVAAAKAQGYRSRAAFKLKEMDERFGLLDHAQRVVDLGSAPGGWCQVVRQRRPRSRVAAIDLLAMDALDGVTFLQMDFLAEDAPDKLCAALDGAPDLVLSDMAANTTGHRQTDHLRTMGLCEAAADFAASVLAQGGSFVAKVFAGGADAQLLARLKQQFAQVRHAKPPASRKDSSEWYVIAQGFRRRETDD
jgi:23S rRNA (uridine2552-2'-O)-methyltransferase